MRAEGKLNYICLEVMSLLLKVMIFQMMMIRTVEDCKLITYQLRKTVPVWLDL